MPVRNFRVVYLAGIIFCLVISPVLICGCMYRSSGDNSSLETTVTTTATPAPPGMNNDSVGYGGHLVAGSPEKIQITVYSATLYHTLPGWNIIAGNGIAVVNVSIKNNLDTGYWIGREYLFIKSERATAHEHGGDRLSPDMAKDYLRFPIKLQPGETKTGSIVYIVPYGTRVNDLILSSTDVIATNNITVMAKIDLNRIYTYA